MGPCELVAELGCASPRVFVGDRTDGVVVVDNAVSEGFVERAVEPLSSLCVSTSTMGRVDDSGTEVVAPGDGVLGIGDGRIKGGCPEPLHCVVNTQVSIEVADSDSSDGSGDVEGDGLDERLDELVLVPRSGFDLSSQAPREEVECSSGEGCSNLDLCPGLIQAKDGIVGDLSRDTNDKNLEPFIERNGVQGGPSIDDPESGNGLSLKCRLDGMCLGQDLCESGMNSCLTILRVEGEVSSAVQEVAVGPGGSAALGMMHANSDCDNIVGSESSKILLIQDTLKLRGCVAVSNLTHVAEVVNKADNTGNGNGVTDGDMCNMKCSETALLPLRRSSRSRKIVQQLPSGNSATRHKKKASKDSLRRTRDLLPEATRKKQSRYSRSMCSSGWGTSENLLKYFHLSNELAVNQVMDQGTRKKKAPKRRGKKDVLQVVERSAFPEIKQEVSSRPAIRLKVTFGKNDNLGKGDVISPAVVDSPDFQLGNDDKLGSFCSTLKSSRRNVIDISVPKEIPSLIQCNNSTSDVQLASSNLEKCSVPGKTSLDDSSQLDFEKQDASCADKVSNPGTSPDSEVIDQLLDSSIGPRAITSLHDFVMKASHCDSDPRRQCETTKKSKSRRKRKDKLCQTGILALECQRGADKAKMPTKDSDNVCTSDTVNGEIENHPNSTTYGELLSMESLPVAAEDLHQSPRLDNVAGINIYSRMIIALESVPRNSCDLLTPAENLGKKISKVSKTKGKSRNKSKSTDELQKDPSSQQKGKKKLTNKHKIKETGIAGDAYENKGPAPGTAIAGNLEVINARKTDFSKEVAVDNASCRDLIPSPNGEQTLPTAIGEQTLVPRVAWVCCDDCLKWRCIPAILADVIGSTNCKWTCKDNQDQGFADCSIPQEKSNSEINAELQISDEEDARDGHLGSKGSGLKQVLALQPSTSQPSTWMLIKSNIFLHRSRKTQTMDEIMVCHCKPPVDGSLGCGSHCLNRMLNIECVQGTCPCGDLCSNQQFQRRQYAEMSWLRCGKKGYGLQVLEDISEGKFLIEYVGEVLDLQTYEARQKDYASKGHKHFYFMTLNGNEVIDASAKGNLGRFVNHSCDPNCRTEKWVVNGEICVGLFALRSIKKGEELTFDYNYVRVFGAAAKKCHCGSQKCRGYIGGDPNNAEITVQADSDEEFPEPIVVNENGEIDRILGDMMAKSSSQDNERVVIRNNLSEDRLETVQPVAGKESIDEVRESTDSTIDIQFGNVRIERFPSVKINTSSAEPTRGTPTLSTKSDVLHVENTYQKSVYGSIDSSDRVSEVEIECEPHARLRPCMKISRPSKSVKNRKSSCSSTAVGKVLSTIQRPKILSCKPKRLSEGSASGHHEDVEKNLNELLDADGGICKKKDASKGYLKLLLLTAASGDCGNGGAIQSNRILSMILDAMLKTKSRGVLKDIVNKNGLQMLHNMMKLYRSDFNKIPILRKLLKVLEFLAEKEILTVEHIHVESLHPGVESFRESILFFTEHDDNQVHHIARSFRDKWIPEARKLIPFQRNERWREFRRWSDSSRHNVSCHNWRDQGPMAVECSTRSDQSGFMSNLDDARIQEASSAQLCDGQTLANRPRKRKSRWDQPASPKKNGKSQKVENGGGQRSEPYETKEEENNCCGAQNILVHTGENMMHTSDDDAPPGFSYLHDVADGSPPGFPAAPCPVSLGLLQAKFNSNLPVAYGIPFSVVQKFGTQCETVDSWEIAPAIPFQPFPPLPPYPHDKRPLGDQEEVRQDYHTHAGNQDRPSTSGSSHNTVGSNQNMVHNERDGRNFSGKRYHRRKNWISPKRRPPWARNIDWGFKGNYPPHPRNGSFRHKHGNGS